MLRCHYKRTDMTPCVIEDGAICYSDATASGPLCVGCERTVEAVNAELGERGADAIYPADVGRQSGGARGARR